jgi:hypothetical protein
VATGTAWVPDGVRQGMPISRTLVDRYVRQGFSSTHMMDGSEAYAHSQMSVIEGICARASSACCSMSGRSGARLALRAREQLVRSERDGLVTHDGWGTSLTHDGGGDVELGRRVERTGGRHGGEKLQFVAGGVHPFLED